MSASAPRRRAMVPGKRGKMVREALAGGSRRDAPPSGGKL